MIIDRNDYLEEQLVTDEPKGYQSTATTTNNSRIPIIYGRRRTSGQLIFTYPGNNVNTIYAVLALCEGQIYGAGKIFINGSFAGYAGGHDEIAYPSYNSIYRGYASWSLMDGRSGTNYNGLLSEVKRKNFDRLAYLVVKLYKDTENPEIFNNGFPAIEVEVTGNNNVDRSPSPAAVIKDLLTNTRYGAGIAASKVDITDADAYTETFLKNYGSATGKIVQCNAIIDTGKSFNTNIQSLLNEFQLIMPRINGVYYVKAEATGGSATVITESDIIGRADLLYPDSNNILDRVSARFPYGYVDYSTATISLVYDDNEVQQYNPALTYAGLDKIKTIDLPNITDVYQARRMATALLLKSKNAAKLSITLGRSHQDLEVGDLIALQNVVPDNLNATYKITRKSIGLDFTINIEAIKYVAANYTGSPVTKVKFEKPLISTGNGYIYYPKQEDGQDPIEFILPPTQRDPGDIRPTDPVGADVISIADAVTLDDNDDWYFVNTSDAIEKETRNYNDGVSLQIITYADSAILHGEFSLVAKYPNRPLYQNIAYLYPINEDLNRYGHAARVGNSIIIFDNGSSNDLLIGSYRTYNGSRRTSFRDNFNARFSRSPSLLTNDDQLNGLYTLQGRKDGLDLNRFGLNYIIPQKINPDRPTLHSYGNGYPFTSTAIFASSIDIKFFGQAKTDGGWEYIGKKSVAFNFTNIAPAFLRNARRYYRQYTGKVMPE